MRSRLLCAIALASLVAASTALARDIISSRGDKPLADAINLKMVVHRVSPAYPVEARRSGLQGRGILVGQVDFKTGVVTSVQMEKSTGHKILDDAALSAFRQWQFKPGTVRKFRTPITYVMSSGRWR